MRLDLLEEIYTLSQTEEKTVLLVKNCLEQKFYIKKIIKDCTDRAIYRQLIQHPHPRIPILYDAAYRGDACILIEEFINGKTLEYVLSERTLGNEDIHHIMRQLLSAVNHLHHLRPPIIHRDIKPGNIMVLDHLEIKLIDFEIAREFKLDKNRDTRVMGSAGYASPEQYGFHQSDCRSDIYALGAVLKTMVQMDVNAEDINSSFKAIIEKCMQLDPERRYQDISELSEALGYGCATESQRKRFSIHLLFQQLPGFHGDVIGKRLLFLGYYVFCAILASTLTITPPPSLYMLFCQRISFGLCFAVIPAIAINAGNVLELLSFRDYGRKDIRFIKGVILWFLCVFIIISLFVILATILESLL